MCDLRRDRTRGSFHCAPSVSNKFIVEWGEMTAKKRGFRFLYSGTPTLPTSGTTGNALGVWVRFTSSVGQDI